MEALINSMDNADESKITTSCVSKLSNSGTLLTFSALGLAHEYYIHLSRVNQRFPRCFLYGKFNSLRRI